MEEETTGSSERVTTAGMKDKACVRFIDFNNDIYFGY